MRPLSPLPPISVPKTDPILGQLRIVGMTNRIRTDELYERTLAQKIHPIVRRTIQKLAECLIEIQDGVSVLDCALRNLPLGVGEERYLSSCNALMRTVAKHSAVAAAVLLEIDSFAEEIRSDMKAILSQAAVSVSPLPPSSLTQTYVFGVAIPNSAPAHPTPPPTAPRQRPYGPPPGRAHTKQQTP